MTEEKISPQMDWLEVEGPQGTEHKHVHCPVQSCQVPIHECMGCKRFETMALDPSGKHVYVVCDVSVPCNERKDR